ncbi:SDR family oxidoreductase [Myceligenerans crystallogenes]|uniref:SDR family oxidoreductase n=1 Tax=Myceligenerans crystallogenes TaxID=316335 RepID=A0ABN2NF53_9MICO
MSTDVESRVRTAHAQGPRTGEWAVVLGASSGMGAAVARRLAAEGMSVLGVHLDTAARAEEADRLADELRATGVEVRFVNANAASRETCAEIVAGLAGTEPADPAHPVRVGLLFHSLAFGSLLPYLPRPGEPRDDKALLSSRQMTMTLEVMAHSLVWWTRELIDSGLLGQGSHVMAMTSAGDTKVSTSYGAVSAAKAALLAHVRQLAVEAAPYGVAVNAVRAGVTITPSFDRIPGSARLAEVALAANPHERLTTTDDVAEIVSTLVATRSSWMTGNVVAADGGEGLTT